MSGPARPGGAAKRQAKPYRRPQPDVARKAAFDLLRAVDERDAYANLVLPELLRERRFDARDAGFATELSYGTLRGRGTYDAVLASCIDRPLAQVDPPVLDVLRLGAHQLLAMRVPPHAAVAATVELARAVLGDSRSSFVNAVLRKVSVRDLDEWITFVAPDFERDPIGYLAVAYSHPRWVIQSFADALGGSLAEVRLVLAADNEPPRVTLVARPGRSTVAELVAAGAEPGRWSPYAATWPAGGAPGSIAEVRDGRVGVQDEGSQLVAQALTLPDLAGSDERWLDLAAGPGGKAALLEGLAAERGAWLLAAELQPHRARLVARSLAGGTTVVADGTAGAWRPGSFDRVLADVPCSGLGALRRRPESRWRRQPSDLASLAPLQRRLLSAAVDAVRPGGLVAYATCSPHVAETLVVVTDVRKARSDIEVIDARPFLPGVSDLGPGPFVQLWPHRHGTDAMFLALLRRTN